MADLAICKACRRQHATGVWRVVFAQDPDSHKLLLLCATCGLSNFPSRSGVLTIKLVHSLFYLHHDQGPECTSTLELQPDAVKINGRVYISARCPKCNFTTQLEASEANDRKRNHTHANLRHPDHKVARSPAANGKETAD